MIIEEIDKYLTHINIVDIVNNIGKMDIYEVVDYLVKCDDNENRLRILSMLDEDKREEIEKLIDGGFIGGWK